MKRISICAAAAALFLIPASAAAQQPLQEYIVSTYRAAPGHQVELLRWMAGQDRISQAAGTPRMMLYVHTNGSSWDYLVIQPVTTPEQDAAFEAAAARLGIPQGPRVGLELRRHLAEHDDTHTVLTTPAEYLAQLGER